MVGLPANRCEVIKRFVSRKNEVDLVSCKVAGEELLFIKKTHKTVAGAENESIFLEKLLESKVPVPRLYALDNNILYLEHLDGYIFTDLLEHNLIPVHIWTEALARWFWTLHSSLKSEDGQVVLKNDNNLRNFIFSSNKVFGLDFEEYTLGFPEEDIGQVCAYILANRPAFTDGRLAEVTLFVSKYYTYNPEVSIVKVENIIIEGLMIMAERKKEDSSAIKAFVNSIIDCKHNHFNSQAPKLFLNTKLHS